MNATSASTKGRSPAPTSSYRTGGHIYAAPDGIVHYISAHWYRPPDEFMEAVMACPGMGSAEYGAALMANGAPELAEGFEPGWDDKFVAQSAGRLCHRRLRLRPHRLPVWPAKEPTAAM